MPLRLSLRRGGRGRVGGFAAGAVACTMLLGTGGARAQQLHQDWATDCDAQAGRCVVSTTASAPDRTWLSTLRLAPDAAGGAAVQVLVPTGIHLASGLFMTTKGGGTVEAAFQRCTPRACVAVAALEAPVYRSWLRGLEVELRYRPRPGVSPIAFDVSLMGLTAATRAAREAERRRFADRAGQAER